MRSSSISKVLCLVSIVFVLPSCFLFKGGGGHSKPCPAYGQENMSSSNESFAVNTNILDRSIKN